jgi:hypothetical protein
MDRAAVGILKRKSIMHVSFAHVLPLPQYRMREARLAACERITALTILLL